MGEAPVTALARGRKPPMDLALPRLNLALAFGDLPVLCAFLDPPPLVVVRRVIGPLLSIEVALQPSQRFGVGGDLGTEGLEQGVVCAHYRDGGGSHVHPNHAASPLVLSLSVWAPVADHLRITPF